MYKLKYTGMLGLLLAGSQLSSMAVANPFDIVQANTPIQLEQQPRTLVFDRADRIFDNYPPVLLDDGEIAQSAFEARKEWAFSQGVNQYITGLSTVTMQLYGEVLMCDTENANYIEGWNRYAHFTQLLDHTFEDVVTPNTDTLYSQAFVDVREEPYIVTLPNSEGRYFSVMFNDYYTNVEVRGSRTEGASHSNVLLLGPGQEEPAPELAPGQKCKENPVHGLRCNGNREPVYADPAYDQVVRLITPLVFLLVRTGVDGDDDLPNVYAFQDELRLVPLSDFTGNCAASNGMQGCPEPRDFPEFCDDLAVFDSPSFYWERYNRALTLNPPPAYETAMFEQSKTIQVGEGFPTQALEAELNPAERAGMLRSLGTGSAIVKGLTLEFGELINGWSVNFAIGAFGDYTTGSPYDYPNRAMTAFVGFLGLPPEEAAYPYGFIGKDSAGEPVPLDASTHDFTIHFNAGEYPPVDAFWSLTLYDAESGLFVPNDLFKYQVRDSSIVPNPDGSLDVHMSQVQPEGVPVENWIPAPDGEFYLVLRLYNPQEPIFDGSWPYPDIQRVE